MREERPNGKLILSAREKVILYFDRLANNGILKGNKTISSVNVRIPKHEEPILAEILRKIVTDKIEAKINIQDWGSNSFRRFQVGEVLEGNLENQ